MVLTVLSRISTLALIFFTQLDTLDWNWLNFDTS